MGYLSPSQQPASMKRSIIKKRELMRARIARSLAMVWKHPRARCRVYRQWLLRMKGTLMRCTCAISSNRYPSRQVLYQTNPLPLRMMNWILLPHHCRMRIRPRSRPNHQDFRWWHWNSPRLRRTRHVALLHRLLTVRLPLHLCIYIIPIPLQQRLLLLTIVDRHEASIRSCQFGHHSSGYLCCFLGNGAAVACGVVGMAAGVGVAAGGDEEGEVEEPGGGCASARASL